MLDTSVLIETERGRFDLARFLGDPTVDSVGIAAISLSELLQGALRSSRVAERLHRTAFADWVAEHIPVLPFGIGEARRHADLWSVLSGQGARIGLHDLQVAATALAGHHSVATFDEADFGRIPGVTLLDLAPFRHP